MDANATQTYDQIAPDIVRRAQGDPDPFAKAMALGSNYARGDTLGACEVDFAILEASRVKGEFSPDMSASYGAVAAESPECSNYHGIPAIIEKLKAMGK